MLIEIFSGCELILYSILSFQVAIDVIQKMAASSCFLEYKASSIRRWYLV